MEKNFSCADFWLALLKLEERDQPYNPVQLTRRCWHSYAEDLQNSTDIDRPVLVKAHEVERSYERAFLLRNIASSL